MMGKQTRRQRQALDKAAQDWVKDTFGKPTPDPVGEMDGFTVGELADKITGGDQFFMRGLLRDVGLDVNVYQEDRTATVPRWAVIDLAALRAGDRVGRKAAEVLSDALAE